MRFSPEEKTIISFYDTTYRNELISKMEVAVEHIEDEEFDAEDFTSNIDLED